MLDVKCKIQILKQNPLTTTDLDRQPPSIIYLIYFCFSFCNKGCHVEEHCLHYLRLNNENLSTWLKLKSY